MLRRDRALGSGFSISDCRMDGWVLLPRDASMAEGGSGLGKDTEGIGKLLWII